MPMHGFIKTGRRTAAGHIQHATLNSARGLLGAIMSETAVRIEIVLLVAAIPLGVVLAPSIGWYVAMVGVLLATLAVELLNTAIEKLADHVTPEHSPAIGLVKDVGSAAVLCMLVLAALIWAAAAALRLGWL